MAETKTGKTDHIPHHDDDFLYEQAVLRMRREIAKGKTFAQACETLKDIDENLRPIIQDDLLKIIIAEQHFGQGRGIDDVALFLDLPYDLVEASRARIISDFDEMITGHYSNTISKMTH